MSFNVNWDSVQSIRCFEEAEAYFNNKKKPRTSRWPDDMRPLRGTRDRHLSLERRETHYALTFYNRTLVRYYKPAGDTRLVEILNPTGHRANYKFHDNMGWRYGKSLASDIGPVRLVTLRSSEPKGLSASLLLRNGVLQTKESWQLQFYRQVATKDQKEERNEARRRLEPYILLLEAAIAGENIDDTLYETMGKRNARGWKTGTRLNRIRTSLDLAAVKLNYVEDLLLHRFLSGEIDEIPENLYAAMLTTTRRLYSRHAAAPQITAPVTYKYLIEFFVGSLQRKARARLKPQPMWFTGALPQLAYFSNRAGAESANNT